jgi:hypothetical protein
MRLNVDVPQPNQWILRSAELARPWILGLIAVRGGRSTKPADGSDSFLSECECPENCLRDHENE